jgi:hypothetical protein
MQQAIQAALRQQYMRAQRTKSFQILKNYPCGKMLHQDRDFSTIDAIKRQIEERWRRKKIVLFVWG